MAALDASGKQKEDLMHHIYKQRLDKSGMPIGSEERSDLKSVLRANADKDTESGVENEQNDDCGSCYGAGEQGQCCTTCDEIRQLYKKKG